MGVPDLQEVVARHKVLDGAWQQVGKSRPLRPNDLRHPLGFDLAAATGNDANELQRCLGHQFQRYINSYPKPRLDIAAGCSEGL